jgi:hypothetical protein
MSAQPMPAPHWFTVTHKDGTPARFLGCPILVRNQAERTAFCERMKLDPWLYDMREATPAEISAGQVGAEWCKPSATYELPPEVLESMRRRDRLTDARVKLRHDMDLLVTHEAPTSEGEVAAIDALVAELGHWQLVLDDLRDGYEPKDGEE